MIIGITGGIACGKSSAVEYFLKYGAVIIDADKIAREVTESKEIIEKIIDVFGIEYVVNGKLDRKKLRNRVFNDKEELKKLNEITHPIIIERIKEEIEKNRKNELVVADIPLLYETGLNEFVDKSIVIHVPFEIQLERIMERDGVDYSSAQSAIRAQMSVLDKIKRADYVIENGGTKKELGEKIFEFIVKLKEGS